MRKFKLVIILFFVVIATSCGQQKEYISYTVKKGETMKVIAKRLGIKTKDLLRLNPTVGRKPSPETAIIIPNNKFDQNTPINITIVKETDTIVIVDDVKEIEDSQNKFLVHKVVKGDTFYSLTRAYNVSENELKALNLSLEISGLQLEMLLKIKPIVAENIFLIYRDTISEAAAVKIAMMLPFRAIEYDTIDAIDIFKTNKLSNITTDLYLGAQVALDSLRSLEIDVELSVFDTGRKNTKIDSILSVTDFNDIDAIIGPLYSEEVPKVANRAGVPVIFPVYSKKQSSFQSSKIIKTFADREVHQKELVAHILRSYSNENILIIGDSTATSIRNSDLIKSVLLDHDSITDALIIHPNQGYIRKATIINALKAEIGNWLIFATDASVIVSDVVNSLISLPIEEEDEDTDEKEVDDKEKDDKPEMQILPEDTVIKIFGFNKSSQFDIIDNNKLAKLGFTYTSDIFIDEGSPKVQLFNKQYLEKNYAYPSYYATKGFDIVFDVVMRLASGDPLKETFKKGISTRLESKFNYNKSLFSTSTNTGIYILQYNPDLTITRIK
ncbi:MAG: LysM peptidoglycan-binding domain-containing protein [Flavobacterium sp.]|nr:LysM peptidoglycan-binding domain-containing protein [Flavobacterium sp.]